MDCGLKALLHPPLKKNIIDGEFRQYCTALTDALASLTNKTD
jgi:hypothetical protein